MRTCDRCGYPLMHTEYVTCRDCIDARPTLFDEMFGDTTAEQPDPPSPWEQFERFHRAHPEVYVWLAKQTRQIARRRFGHGAIEFLWNNLRWVGLMSPEQRRIMELPDDAEEYTLNNNYKPFYARLILIRNPDLDDVFKLRRSIADDHLEDLRALGGGVI